MLTGSAKEIIKIVDKNGMADLDLGMIFATGKFLQDTLKNPLHLVDVSPDKATAIRHDFRSKPYWFFLKDALDNKLGYFYGVNTKEIAIKGIKRICNYVTD